MNKPHLVIISPALEKANNGNWQTAQRWQKMLREHYRVSIVASSDAPLATAPDAIIALHARRSAQALAAYTRLYPALPSILVLTGTDLYRDISTDADAQRSLELARHLVVLQEAGLEALDATQRAKAHVIYQSAPSLVPHTRSADARQFNVVMIGHLREEKDPQTFMRAAALIATPSVRLLHIGSALDAALGQQAESTQRDYPRYRWLGSLTHAATRQRLKRSQLMVITSKMEGGANVIIEAVTSGVPVLVSDISGNRGMLGADYVGYFGVGNDAALARLIERACNDAAFYQRLQQQCQARAPLFAPAREKAALLQLMDNVCS